MTTFIPFPDGNSGNPKQIASEVFAEGQEIKVRATGNLPGANPSQLIKTSAAVEIEPASSLWVSVPLDSSITTYGMLYGEYTTNRNSIPNYKPMAWVTFQELDFTSRGLNIPSTGNAIANQADADAYEEMMYQVSLQRLAAQSVSLSSSTPICIDPEDLGVDKALFYHDIYSAWLAEGSPNPTSSFARNLHPYEQDGVQGFGNTDMQDVDIATAAPLIIQMFKNLKERLNALFPNSPIGFYSVGSAAFWLTGWSGVYKNSTNTASSLYKSYEIMERMFDANLAEDEAENSWGWRTMNVLDFVFNSYYPALNDAGKMPFVRYGAKLEVLKNFLHLFIDKFSGTAQGNKMMIGTSVRANVSESDLSNQDLIYSAIAKNDTTLTVAGEPVDWYNSTLTYPDINSVALLSNNAINSPFVYTPMAMQGDLIKWMNLSSTDAPPAGFQSAPPAASPSGGEAGLSALTGKSLRDFPMAIWDGGYISLYTGIVNQAYPSPLTTTPDGGQVATFRSLYTKQSIMDAYTASLQTLTPYQTGTDTWLSDAMDADAANYITMFSTKGSQDWYSSSASPTPKYEFTADLDVYTASNNRWTIANVIESGETDEINPTANTQLMRYNDSGNDGIDFLLGMTGSVTDTTPGLAAKLYADTGSGLVEFVTTSVNFGTLFTLLTMKFVGDGSPGSAGTLWDSLSSGDPIKVELFWD